MTRFQNTNDRITDLSAACLFIVIWRFPVDEGKRSSLVSRRKSAALNSVQRCDCSKEREFWVAVEIVMAPESYKDLQSAARI
jgi:hypothetical protein